MFTPKKRGGEVCHKTTRHFVAGVCAISLGVISSLAFAQTPDAAIGEEKELGEIEVTAIRSGATVADTAQAVSVVNSVTLSERPAAAGIQSVLSEVPGIQFSRSGSLNGQIVMRGFNSNSTRSIVTVDGDRYLGRSTLEFNMFDADGIERVEIIRGASSAYYGADAMNGVVNVVSRRAKIDPHQDTFEVTPRLKSIGIASVNNMVGARGELEGGGKGFDFLIGLSGRVGSDFDTPEGRVDNSAYRLYGLDFNMGYSLPHDLHQSRIELSGRFTHADTERGGGLGAAPGAHMQEVSEKPIIENYLRLAYSGKNFGVVADSIDATVYRRLFKTDIYQANRTNPAVTAMPHLQVYSPLVWGGHVTALKGVGDHLLGYGMDLIHEDNDGRLRQITRVNPATGAVIGQTPWERVDRTRVMLGVGAYVSDEWKALERLTLSGALRFDYVKQRIGKKPAIGENAAITAAFGDNPGNKETAVTGNLGAVFKLTPVWDLTASLSRGFRAPTGELTTAGTAGTINNLPEPDLKPEYNWTAEVGARWHSDKHRGSVVVYQSRYSDLITSVRIDSSNFKRKNVGKVEMSGLELEGEWKVWGNLSARYMVAATHGTDKSSDTPMPYVAPWVGRLAVRYEGNDWYAEPVWRGYKGKTRIDKSQENKSGSYAMLDIYAGMNLGKFLGAAWRDYKVVVGVENVLDRAGRNPTVYEDISYPRGVANPLLEPGRNFVLKIVSNF